MAIVFLCALSAARAHADEPRPIAVLEYDRARGAESCPSEPSLRRSVAAHLGYDPFVAAADLRVVARIVATRRGLLGTVEAREGDAVVGRREIPSPTADCIELARALALAISVAVDPFSLTRDGGAERDAAVVEPAEVASGDPVEPEQEAEQALASEPQPENAPVPMPTPHETPRFRFGGGLGLALGTVPRPRPFVAAHTALALPRAGVRLDIRFDAPASVDGDAGGRVRGLALGARLYGCARIGVFEPCGGGGLSVLFAEGEGVDDPGRATELSPLLGVAAFVRLPGRGMLGASMGFGLDVPLLRPRLAVQLEPAWTMPPVTGFFVVAIDVRP